MVGILEGSHIVKVSHTAGFKCKLFATAFGLPQFAAVAKDNNSSAVNTFQLAAAKSFDSFELAD